MNGIPTTEPRKRCKHERWKEAERVEVLIGLPAAQPKGKGPELPAAQSRSEPWAGGQGTTRWREER